jgi:fructokinase
VSLRIGIDLGGTKIEGITLDGSREIARLRVATPRDDYDATLDAIVSVTRELESRGGGSASVGVGIPGTMSPATGLVKNANSVWLIGRPLLNDLAERLQREVRIANDANCFAVSEAADGAAAGAGTVFGVILGTGVGAGVVVRGEVLTGANAIAGEWGHNPLPWADERDQPAPDCYCGRRGCLETYLSGPGLAADHRRRTGQTTTVPELTAQAAAGDRAATDTLNRYVSRAARGMAAVINVLDPDIIVIGGGLSNIPGLCDAIPQLGQVGLRRRSRREGANAARSRRTWGFERRPRRCVVVARCVGPPRPCP